MLQAPDEVIFTSDDVITELFVQADPVGSAAPDDVTRHVTLGQTPHVRVALVEYVLHTLVSDKAI